MRRHCENCGRSYDDCFCSTRCPHKGIGGYCAVCDCYVCICKKDTSPDWERSNANTEKAK